MTLDVNLLTQFTAVDRRSVPISSGFKAYAGRWVNLNSSGEAVAPTGAGRGLLVLEGNYAALTVDGSKDVVTEVALPSSVAANQAALACGVFRAEVDAHGFIATSIVAGSKLELDSSGRLVIFSAGVHVATAETISSTKLVFRTVGN